MSARGYARERRRGEGLATALAGALLLLVGLPLVVLPFGAPAAGAALLAGGLLGRRGAGGPLTRSVARGAVIAGGALLVLGLWVALGYATGRGVQVESG